MRLLDWIRGRPRDTQADRMEARRGENAAAEAGDVTAATTPEEVVTSAEVSRDQEAARHQGI